jgi:transcriptional regulator with XRE-family HTH domain
MAKLRVKQIVKQKGLTLARVAEMLEIHPVNLTTTLNGNPTISTLEKIAKVLEVEVVDLIERESGHTINGFIKIDEEVIEISSVEDLEKVLEKVRSVK